MNGPRRLKESGGDSESFLLSASIDKPSRASRNRAIDFAGTASSFVTSTGGAPAAGAKRGSFALYKTVAMWVCVGALGGGTAALVISELAAPGSNSAPHAAATPLEPLVVPEPVVAASQAPALEISPEPLAPSAERKQIEAARAALARGDSSSALQALDSYDAAYPNGALKAESAALRVQAVSKAGDSVKAR